MNETNNGSVSDLIRRRRRQLRIKQSLVAAALRVEPQSVAHWECGRRRPELDKMPRLAAILQLDPKMLCRAALCEWHPCLSAALFGTEPQRILDSPTAAAESGQRAITAGPTNRRTFEVDVVVADTL